jgi:hypothetical protein
MDQHENIKTNQISTRMDHGSVEGRIPMLQTRDQLLAIPTDQLHVGPLTKNISRETCREQPSTDEEINTIQQRFVPNETH